MREMRKKQEKTGYSLVSSGNNGGDLLAVCRRKYRKRMEVFFPLTICSHQHRRLYIIAKEKKKSTCRVSLLKKNFFETRHTTEVFIDYR